MGPLPLPYMVLWLFWEQVKKTDKALLAAPNMINPLLVLWATTVYALVGSKYNS